jgi:Antibiotic biosynthesis monooxygenase
MATMITVFRRWFVPPERQEWFTGRWRSEILPAISGQPGCVRVEVYESSTRDHWVTAITWESKESRLKAMEERLTRLLDEFTQYERSDPEILTLRLDLKPFAGILWKQREWSKTKEDN